MMVQMTASLIFDVTDPGLAMKNANLGQLPAWMRSYP